MEANHCARKLNRVEINAVGFYKDKFIFYTVMGKELMQECKGTSAMRLPSHKSDPTSSVLSGWKDDAAWQSLNIPKDGSCITSGSARNDNFLLSGQTQKLKYLVPK